MNVINDFGVIRPSPHLLSWYVLRFFIVKIHLPNNFIFPSDSSSDGFLNDISKTNAYRSLMSDSKKRRSPRTLVSLHTCPLVRPHLVNLLFLVLFHSGVTSSSTSDGDCRFVALQPSARRPRTRSQCRPCGSDTRKQPHTFVYLSVA
jgi:hypothetical protein